MKPLIVPTNQQELEQAMRCVAEVIAELFPEQLFSLILFEREHCLSNYISNANRQDMVKALREAADKLEQHIDIPATSPTQMVQ